MRIRLAVTVLAALASVLEAQSTTRSNKEYALIYGRRISKASLAKAIRLCDDKVLRPHCGQLDRKVKEMFPAILTDSVEAHLHFADYIETLESRPCAPDAKLISTEWIPAEQTNDSVGMLVVASHTTNCAQNENLLWDKEENKPIISLYDGNLVASYIPGAVNVASIRTAQQARVPSDTPKTQRRTTSDTRIPLGKGAPITPRAVTGKPGVAGPPGVAGTDCAGLPPTIPARTCLGVVTARKGFPIWRTLGAVVAGIVGGAIVCEHNPGYGGICPKKGDRGGDNNNTNININGGMRAMRGISLTIP